MTPELFQKVYPVIADWIKETLTAHSGSMRPVITAGFRRLPLYFSRDLLASAKFVIVDRVPVPPLLSMGLSQFANFEAGDYDGITYLDTFFVRQSRITDERLYFHELIHIIQWRLLGTENFLRMYAMGLEDFGYRESPLEVMAYEAEDIFVNQSTAFNAEDYVKNCLNKMGSV